MTKLQGFPSARQTGEAIEVKPVGARALWRERVRAGAHGQDTARPSTWIFDALYWAACREEWGFDELRAGQPNIAASLFNDAADVLYDAALAKARGEARSA